MTRYNLRDYQAVIESMTQRVKKCAKREAEEMIDETLKNVRVKALEQAIAMIDQIKVKATRNALNMDIDVSVIFPEDKS